MTAKGRLLVSVYAPALTGDDGRTLAAVRGMEKALPGLRLEWEVSKDGQPIALPRRDAWLSEAATRGKFPLLCNGDERNPVTISGLQRPARPLPDGQPQLQVHAKLPLDSTTLAVAAAVLEGAAEGTRSFWGHASPSGYGSEVAQQMRSSEHGPERSPRGLPMLLPPEELRSPEIPHYLAWINYWSAATARAIGFPDPARDAALLTRARRTASGGWVVQLTDPPLDLDNINHLDVLRRVYERFPGVGGRATP
ncbi:hypothetical protein SAMN05443572_104731 [Myxococcus fulvus]|uniref:Immunity protein 52 domain-containing protein n=1 Tax=Myxococcus fulvus TaxID=33 RepID=A0A511SXJ6_MYXFU|nr:DUF5953 family protein [Myxococcus fulvus]GEN06635.1 hypothetical protein MFU01_16720 [Myxococcus fulvus]SEU07363.1 hypothetical protein SAMN05443572_104731 [Myxococcus fulvus]